MALKQSWALLPENGLNPYKFGKLNEVTRLTIFKFVQTCYDLPAVISNKITPSAHQSNGAAVHDDDNRT